ncbi:hypothetical protein EBT16_07180 [bacterium]|nr:hypothetical protein [bacterium]
MRKFYSTAGILFFFLGTLPVQAADHTSLDLFSVRRDLLEDHRVFEKVIEGKSEWESYFCKGVYSYRVMLRTQLKELDIDLAQDGSVVLKSVLHEPYVGFQGNYQGAYSFCFPISQWTGLSAENARVEAKVEFSENEDGRVSVKIKVNSVEFGRLMTESFSDPWEARMTDLLNRGLSQVWASQLGDWFNSKISTIVNQHIPGHP